MNVNDISSYLYTQSVNGTTQTVASSTTTGETTEAVANAFASTLNEEVSKVSQLTELAGALGNTSLSSMVSNASGEELSALAEDMLGTSGGREVLSKLIDGHFQSMVLTGDDDDDSDDDMSSMLDSYTQTVNESKELLNKLESIMENLSTTDET